MNLVPQAVKLLRNHPTVQAWPKMTSVLATETTPLSWEFPAIICHAIGKDPAQTVPALAALGSIQLGIILVDDILDEDPRGEYHVIGAGRASNLAAAFQALGLDIVLEAQDVSKRQKGLAGALLNKMALDTAHGQALDIQNPKDEAAYWRMVRAKSAPYYGAAFALGAVFSDSAPEIVSQIEALGRLYGEMVQIHDDTKDSLERPINPDWVQGRFPLPILFAHGVTHPDQKEFQTLHAHLSSTLGAKDEGALARAQEILVHSGAIAYCMDQLVARYGLAQDLLKELDIETPRYLEELIEALIQPLRNILEDLGATAPAMLAK